jgi:hypothetical protein
VQPKPETSAVQHPSNIDLGLRVLRLDCRHRPASDGVG